MTNIAFNFHIHTLLKVKYVIFLGLLPYGFMLASLAGMWLTALVFEFDMERPILDFDNPILILVVLLTSGLGLMMIGYLLGWLLNIAISLTCFNWTKPQIKQVYLYSQVPAHWLKEATSIEQAMSAKMQQWQLQRQKGTISYVLRFGVFGWGLFMFFAMSIVPILTGKKPFELSLFLIDMCVWAVGGALFGYIYWLISEREYRKYNPKK